MLLRFGVLVSIDQLDSNIVLLLQKKYSVQERHASDLEILVYIAEKEFPRLTEVTTRSVFPLPDHTDLLATVRALRLTHSSPGWYVAG